uniref:Uncharacterized protein n=1 Tax=Setaria viridis TaxID=4556 RepID=A0A4U6T8R2_SETVI|nr:hypothetical protein SEVIR_9G223250v2 [Setaria viridis]
MARMACSLLIFSTCRWHACRWDERSDRRTLQCNLCQVVLGNVGEKETVDRLKAGRLVGDE